MTPEQAERFVNGLGDDRNHWRDRAVVAEARVARLDDVAAAARAVVQYNDGPETWPRVWRALEQAVAALDEGKERSDA